uniref:Uncharacterized protein n=1 Tax=Nelumbo nucifera TaxID=4432 RepID=A0A822YTE4_NELNU|nr:TPA_asm: hypothetical protein HUJ06_006410 [Nelumbo nucifera]
MAGNWIYYWGNGSNPSGRIQQVRVNFCRRFTTLLLSPDLDLYWQHVVRNSDLNENTEKKYREEVAALEGQARKIYHTDDNFNVVPTGDQFVDIMVKQGCFILQVALCSLGGLAPLGYPEDGNLGKDWDKEMIDNWVSSMFSISKQFPLFILQKLMEQSFFQTVLSRGKWKKSSYIISWLNPLQEERFGKRTANPSPCSLAYSDWA